jgi:DNA mismatch repair protein MutL
MTLGFRGEALAAIASVTEMRIMTAKADEPVGTLVTASYGALRDVADSGCPVGTTIICESMFAQTPARLKFMKSNASETAYVASVMEKIAISHPEVAVKFIADGKLRFSTRGDGNLQNAIYSVFGAFATKLAEVKYSYNGLKVKGYISTPDNVRGNRAMQHFFINERCVKNKTLTAALEQAFRSYIPHDKFPSCVLNISLNHSLVDVNIHPSKLEVKFSDERAVFDVVYYAVRSALENALERPALDALKKETSRLTEEKLKVVSAFVPKDEPKYDKVRIFDTAKPAEEKREEVPKAEPNFTKPPEFEVPEVPRYKIDVDAEEFSTKPVEKGVEKNVENVSEYSGKTEEPGAAYYEVRKENVVRANPAFLSEEEASKLLSQIPPSEEAPEPVPPPMEEASPPAYAEAEVMPEIPTRDAKIPGKEAKEIPEYTIIGELYASYVIMQLEDKVLIVDKHAAHERINFEILRAGMASLKPDSQMLIIPESLTLSAQEAVSAAEFAEEINACGFVFEIKDGKTVLISGVPSGFEVSGAKDMFYSLICELCEHGANIEFRRRSIFEAALYQTACKASIKAGRVYDEAMIRYVCDNLLRYDCIKYCPHGRPVAFELTKRELDRRFGRIK